MRCFSVFRKKYKPTSGRLRIIAVDSYLDGGSIGLTAIDEVGLEAKLCVVRRLGLEDEQWGRVYLGTNFPGNLGRSKKLLFNFPEERETFALLLEAEWPNSELDHNGRYPIRELLKELAAARDH